MTLEPESFQTQNPGGGGERGGGKEKDGMQKQVLGDNFREWGPEGTACEGKGGPERSSALPRSPGPMGRPPTGKEKKNHIIKTRGAREVFQLADTSRNNRSLAVLGTNREKGTSSKTNYAGGPGQACRLGSSLMVTIQFGWQGQRKRTQIQERRRKYDPEGRVLRDLGRGQVYVLKFGISPWLSGNDTS